MPCPRWPCEEGGGTIEDGDAFPIGMKKHRLILKLGVAEKLCVLLRDKQFDGSWETMLRWIRTDGSAEQRAEDIPRIRRLMAYEKKHGVTLQDTLTKELRRKGL